MKISAVIPTRGDVDLTPIIQSLECFDEVLVWDNSKRKNLSVYGRYAIIEEARNEIVFTQDDDVIVSDPEKIVGTFLATRLCPQHGPMTRQETTSGYVVWACDEHDPKPCVLDEVVCNQPQEFRHDFYSDHNLVGFGAVFHRDAPARAFGKFFGADTGFLITRDLMHFNRCCDIVFTGLTPCLRVDVPKENLPHAYADDRMWRQPTHQAERQRMLDLVRRVRDER